LALPYKKFFNNEDLMKKIGNKIGLLLVLLRNIVDWDKNEKLNLYQEYFIKRNLLVASISRHRLAEIFGREDVRRITARVKALEKDGILKIERIPCIDDDDHRKKYNVYILGEVNDDGSYTYFYEK
jgi:coproporphyrinogen III oxidase-like Fe-S oxidoreductase